MQTKNTIESPLGPLTLLADDQQLLGVWFANQTYFGAHYPLPTVPTGENTVIQHATTWLNAYFAGKRPALAALPLAPAGTPFQRQVLELLTQIPYGETVTYQTLADQISATYPGAKRSAARAIGMAVGHNPISIIIPCHRVVGTNGQLTGYAGGLEKKRWLLDFEQTTAK